MLMYSKQYVAEQKKKTGSIRARASCAFEVHFPSGRDAGSMAASRLTYEKSGADGSAPRAGPALLSSRAFSPSLQAQYYNKLAKLARLAILTIFANFKNVKNVCKILQFFGGLVLGCIKTKFCNKICV